MAREIKEKYPEVDYQTQFGLNLSFLLEKVEIKGRKLNLGKVEVYDGTYFREGELYIESETEKAIRLEFKGEEHELNYDNEIEESYEEYKIGTWLPKSQITIYNDCIDVPKWLVKKNKLYEYMNKEDEEMREMELEVIETAKASLKK